MLAEADTIQKCHELRSLALTAADWAKRKGMGEAAVAQARGYAVRAEIKMGELLSVTDMARGGRPSAKTPRETRGVTETLAEIGISYDQSSQAQRLAAMPETTQDALIAGEMTRVQALAPRPHVAQAGGDNEWYTPPEYIAAARAVMGGIDCDPASSQIANETVHATTFYAVADDGLSQQWTGKVWMNPPYAQPLVTHFAKALADNIRCGATTEACVLVNNATETGWFQGLLEIADAMCLIRGRVQFVNPDGIPGAPLQGQVVLYFGKHVLEFNNEFSTFGPVFVHAIF